MDVYSSFKYVSMNEELSKSFDVSVGVRQGCVRSSLHMLPKVPGALPLAMPRGVTVHTHCCQGMCSSSGRLEGTVQLSWPAGAQDSSTLSLSLLFIKDSTHQSSHS